MARDDSADATFSFDLLPAPMGDPILLPNTMEIITGTAPVSLSNFQNVRSVANGPVIRQGFLLGEERSSA